MRIREKDDKFMITLKVPTIRGHEEFECYVNENTSDAINQSEIRKVLNELNISKDIIVLGECTTYRAIVDTDKAELCFDINEYNQITDYEIEYVLDLLHYSDIHFDDLDIFLILFLSFYILFYLMVIHTF